MGWLEAALLGLVQGLTEFLPVSSSGHLVMVESMLGQRGEGLLFEIGVHVGTLLAVLAFYRRRILQLALGAFTGSGDAWRYAGKLAAATLPGVVAALTAKDFFAQLFDEPWVVGLALMATGLMLWTTRWTTATAHAEEPSWAVAVAIGCVQVLAIVPGISRSGATVAAALRMGVSPLAAAEFSFLMSVAAIGGAALLEIPNVSGASQETRGLLLLAVAVAAASGLGALWLFVRLLRTRHFYRFAYYTWAAGAAFLVWLALAG